MNTTQWKMDTKVGAIYLVASDAGLHGLFWRKSSAPMAKSLAESGKAVAWLAAAVVQIEEYLDGKRREFDLPLVTDGTAFQKRVWKQLTAIPYGKTCSYSDVARKISNAKAVRAVGSANGRNPISIIVPCHRVIASDGTLGGYGGGLKTKELLLALEQRASGG